MTGRGSVQCVNGTEACEVAQTCVWFTEGTSIGCAQPGGDSPSPSPHCNTSMNATNNDPYYRTMALNVTALSKHDAYRWNPWRSPGNAPIYDACGMAGGAPKWVHTALSFYDTGEPGCPVLSISVLLRPLLLLLLLILRICWLFAAHPLRNVATENAKQGDRGSKVLPPNPTGVVWKAGDTVETKWNIRANHGGGCELLLP